MTAKTRKSSSAKVQTLASFAAISFALGIIFRNALIFAAIPVVIYLILVSLQGQMPGPIMVARTVEKSQLYEEDTSRVRLRASNLGKRTIALVTIEDYIPSELKNEDSYSAQSFALKPGEIRDSFYSVKANTFGVYSLGPIQIRYEDVSGINVVKSMVEDRSVIVVLPKTTERLTHFKISPRKTKPWPGEIVARKIGLGIDNYSIRQYIPGDSFRRINWRASARNVRDDLLLNEQVAELGADTIIILDARPASNLISPEGESLVKNSLRAAISMSDKLLRDRNRVGLITIGFDTHRIPPGYGRRQYNRLVLNLIKVRAGGLFTFENVPSYLKYFYPHLAQVVMVSPLLDREAFSASGEIARSGYELLVLSPNPIDYSGVEKNRRGKDVRSLRISRELALAVRSANLSSLREVGTLVLDWRKDEPLDFALAKNMRVHERELELAKRRPGYH
jgi:uncharacterized protein (DUF58 family)